MTAAICMEERQREQSSAISAKATGSRWASDRKEQANTPSILAAILLPASASDDARTSNECHGSLEQGATNQASSPAPSSAKGSKGRLRHPQTRPRARMQVAVVPGRSGDPSQLGWFSSRTGSERYRDVATAPSFPCGSLRNLVAGCALRTSSSITISTAEGLHWSSISVPELYTGALSGPLTTPRAPCIR